mmetsp:Transcript_19282/g.31561  ORF Transcript_19282/g.31561 Transcript_19282/m.31561 type:complete len:144 (-) Transcript_19282:351-782(-)
MVTSVKLPFWEWDKLNRGPKAERIHFSRAGVTILYSLHREIMAEHDPTRVAAGHKAVETYAKEHGGERNIDKAREYSLARSHEEKSHASHIASLTRKEHHAPHQLTEEDKEELRKYRELRKTHEAPGQLSDEEREQVAELRGD